MLRKLKANLTKLLLYIKSNLVSCIFKFSILSTMLILVYLVCILSQKDSVSSNNIRGAYPIENSEKLMLTIPTETPPNAVSDFNSLYSTTESLETKTENAILKEDDIYIGTHPLFPIQEPTTTPMSQISEITLGNEITPEENHITTKLPEPITEVEIAISTTTEEIITTDINYSNHIQDIDIEEQNSIPTYTKPESAIPIKRSLPIDVPLVLKLTTEETVTETQIEITTSTLSIEEPTEIQSVTTNSAKSQNVEELHNSTNSPSQIAPAQASEDNLFQDNWENHLAENNFKDDYSLHLDFVDEPTKNLFHNEDSSLTATIESTTSNNENDASQSKVKTNEDKENLNHEPYSDVEESQPMFSAQNLLNLFSFDHLPSASNPKATWWPKSQSSSMSLLTESAAKNQKVRPNRISRNDENQEITGSQRLFRQGFDSMLNRKLKDSVSILERLFGNYFL